jgi:hypothetical protein
MKSTVEIPFDRVVWMGQPPSNKAREAQLQNLLEFLGLQLQADGPSTKKLIVGNLEDWKATTWPVADAVTIYIGLFFKTPPDSAEILSAFEKNQITFLWNESARLEEILEPLEDLLKS